MRVAFTDLGWDDYQHWVAQPDRGTLRKVGALIENVRRTPLQGLGKPEALKGDLAGFWSRRITGEHRLVYGVSGQGEAQTMIVIQCRYHY